MARETRIGIALMVLLVGVFGAIVYKKWNGRQPTAMVAASEAALETGSEIAASASEQETPATTPPMTSPAAIEDENPFSTDAPHDRDSLAQTPATQFEPVAQSEPAPARVDALPIQEASQERESFSPAEPNLVPEPEPRPESLFAEVAPPREEPDSVFSSKEDPVSVSPSVVASDSSPATIIEDDPFADPRAEVAATDVEDSKAAPEPEAGTAVIDDPFSDAVEVATSPPAQAKSESFQPAEESSGSFVTEVAPRGTSEVAAAELDATPDPFADTPSRASGLVELDDPVTEEPDAGSKDPSSLRPSSARIGDSSAPKEFLPEDSATSMAGFDEEVKALDSSGFEPQPARTPTENSSAAESFKGEADYYVVAENESYWTISKKIYGTAVYYHALAQFNIDRVKDPNRLRAGWKILTPSASELRARFPSLVANVPSDDSAGSPRSSAAKPGFLLDEQGRPHYRVGDSDTLGGIAQVHLGRASRWVQIYELNRASVADPKSLKPGTVLRLPPDASRVRLVPEG